MSINIADFTRAELYTDSGKWKYTVWLWYPGTGSDWEYDSWNLWEEAKKALNRSTVAGYSGISFKDIPKDWMLVVFDPPGKFTHPIMVKGT